MLRYLQHKLIYNDHFRLLEALISPERQKYLSICGSEKADHFAVHLQNIRRNNATLDLLSRELLSGINMTFLVKELTFYDLSNFVAHMECNKSKGHN